MEQHKIIVNCPSCSIFYILLNIVGVFFLRCTFGFPLILMNKTRLVRKKIFQNAKEIRKWVDDSKTLSNGKSLYRCKIQMPEK